MFPRGKGYTPSFISNVGEKSHHSRIVRSQGVALGHYTHEKNPVLCAAALATIAYIEKHGLVAHARELGRYTLERLQEMKSRHTLIGDVRGLGLFLGIELVKDRLTRERASDEAETVMYAALSRGLSFKTTMGNILTLTPALTITRVEMDRALVILEECISEIEQRNGGVTALPHSN